MYVDTVAFTNVNLDEDAKALIKKAARLLETYGWIKGAYSLADGYCLVGALMEASGRYPSNGTVELSVANSPALRVAINRVARNLPSEIGEELTAKSSTATLHSRIEIWNDKPRRTKRQVLKLMQKSAA